MCLIDEGDGAKVIRVEKRTAARPHPCSECRREIATGEPYEFTAALWVGADHWWQGRTCQHCLAARSWLWVQCDGWLYEGVLVDLEEHWSESWELRSQWLGRAIIGMRRQWKRRDGAGLMPVLDLCTKDAARVAA